MPQWELLLLYGKEWSRPSKSLLYIIWRVDTCHVYWAQPWTLRFIWKNFITPTLKRDVVLVFKSSPFPGNNCTYLQLGDGRTRWYFSKFESGMMEWWKTLRGQNRHRKTSEIKLHPLKTNIFALENWWLEDEISFWGPAYFQVQTVSFREAISTAEKPLILGSKLGHIFWCKSGVRCGIVIFPTMGTHISFIFRGYFTYWGFKTFIFHGFGVQGLAYLHIQPSHLRTQIPHKIYTSLIERTAQVTKLPKTLVIAASRGRHTGLPIGQPACWTRARMQSV